LIGEHIEHLAKDPRPPDAKKLKGDLGYSLRVGVYRILYDVDDEARTVTIYRVKHRRDAYRGL
jgi:mRNA interferase RelE/StbE